MFLVATSVRSAEDGAIPEVNSDSVSLFENLRQWSGKGREAVMTWQDEQIHHASPLCLYTLSLLRLEAQAPDDVFFEVNGTEVPMKGG